MKNQPVTGRILLPKIAATAVLVPLLLFILNQFLLQIYNPAHQQLSERISYAVQPAIYLLYLAAALIVVFIIQRQLSPLFKYLDSGEHYERARKSTLKIPWILILVNSGLWIGAITLFYALQDFKSEGGVPYFWSLTTNSISGAGSAILAALVINRLLIPAKINLKMTDIRNGERDLFINIKIPLIFASGFFYTVLSLIYAARFFSASSAGIVPPLPFSFGAIISVTAVIGLIPVSLNMSLALSEDRIQREFLLNKMKVLTGAKGDLSSKVSLINFDQIGTLASVINSFIEKIRNLVVLADNTGDRIVTAYGDTEELLTNLAGAAGTMLEAINTVDEKMSEQEEEIGRAKTSLEEYFNALTELADNINAQSASVDQTSKAAGYIAESIRNETALIKEIEKQTGALSGITSAGSSHISEFIESIGAVEKSSQVVEEILEQMNTLSEQIDMLAMNAAIEAAHAGETGKGFAVVAEEVRRLSENNAEQSGRISSQVSAMMNSINDGNKKTKLADDAFRDISENVNRTAEHFSTVLDGALKEEEAVEQLMTTVQNLVQITERLKAIAEKQKLHNDSMKELMDKVFSRFSGLKQSMNEQRENRNLVLNSLTQLKEITEINLSKVHDLNEILRQFTL